MNTVSKSSLSPERRRLIELMQRVNFGRIEGLVVRDGNPILDEKPLPRIVVEVKFGGDNGPRPEADSSDFSLKAQVADLFDHLARLCNGRIESLTVKHGLPFGMHLETRV
jgi:hypothetical protein